MNLMGQPAHVGRFCGSRTHTITTEVVRFYLDALGGQPERYENNAPPLLHHSECYAFVGEWYLKNLYGNLHAQQDWELFAPIQIGTKVRSVSTIIDRYQKRGRLYVVNETDLFDAQSQALLIRGRTHQSFLPDGQEAVAKGEFVVDSETALSKKKRPAFPTAKGPDLPAVQKFVDQRTCWMFSGPGRNYHTDKEEAQKLGFPTIVVQGMMSTCFVSEVMHRAFGPDWLTGGRMSIKLTNVLWVDEEITACGKIKETVPEGNRERVHCEVWVKKNDGTRIALGHASALRA
ncbi:MAG: MaoC/PaaZ C-terminal domain-containing protein [Myxococcota bacterium]|nr:MaoC/PaaZ C-terminal domain-containing protein [Myxococcota bacterium]